jgi:hypothetical protein
MGEDPRLHMDTVGVVSSEGLISRIRGGGDKMILRRTKWRCFRICEWLAAGAS